MLPEIDSRKSAENHGDELTIADDSLTVDLQTAAGAAADATTGATAGAAAGGRAPVSSIEPPRGSSIELGRVLRDRYVLVDRLGSGGKGTVFKAVDRYRAHLPEAEQYVAIKILHATAASDGLLASLRREFYRTQTLSHRNIVNVFELDRDGDVDFFTMEFLEGALLSRVMGRLQPLPMSRPQAWAIIREIGNGLDYAHDRKVVHADLKPQNIMITDSGEVRILDFGASSASADQSPEDRLRTRSSLASVTPAYASCELLDGRAPDPRDDIYAFACLSYELLAGAHPFQRRRATEARDFAIVPRRPPGLTRRQWQALTMGLCWHRAGRSISVRAWLDKLSVGRAAGPLSRAHDLQSAPANPRRTWAFGAGALCAGLVTSATIWFSVAALAGKKSGSDEGVARAASSLQLNTGAILARESAGRPADSTAADGAARPAAVPTAQNAAARGTSSEASDSESQAENNARRDVDRSKLATVPPGSPIVPASNYTVRFGERFAEIRIHRSALLAGDVPLVWWTEAASARPGVDYVPQGKAIQAFRKGKSSTSFFVKLVPKALRTKPEVFYIAIAGTGHGASSGQVARAAVWLPTNQDQS
jgi:serine/threonine protein kinase